MERAEELIQRYLDDLATSDEMAELQSLLTSDAAVADRFAAATRLDSLLGHRIRQTRGIADLQAILAAPTPARSPISRRSRRRPILFGAVAATLFVVIGLGVYFLTNRTRSIGQVVSGRIEIDGVESRSLPVGTRIRVAGERDAIVELNDGTRIDLTPASLAQVRGAEGSHRETLELLDGRGRFDVNPGPRSFEVDTPIGKVAVLGTVFTVEVETPERIRFLRLRKRPDWTMTVAVMHGKVRVQHGGDSVELTDGQSRTIVKENAPDLTGAIERIADREDPRFYVRVRSQKVDPVDKIRRVLIRDPVLLGMDALQVGQVVEVWLDRDATDVAYCIALAAPADRK